MQSINKLIVSLKNDGLKATLFLILRKITHPFFYKIRPILKYLKKNDFKKKYGFEIPYNSNFCSIDYLDIDNLVNQILKLKPKNVLELGTGYSTYAIMFALMKLKKDYNHEFNFYAVDQNEEYMNIVKNYLPKDFSENIHFLYRPTYVEKYNNELMSFYEDLPKINFDYIYEDRSDDKRTKLAGDIFKFENSIDLSKHTFSFTIDDMPITMNYLKKNLKGNYKITGEVFHGTNFTTIK